MGEMNYNGRVVTISGEPIGEGKYALEYSRGLGGAIQASKVRAAG